MANFCVETNDIVRFRKANPSHASQFCVANGLTGKVLRLESTYCVIDFGLGYKVYAAPKYLEVVVKKSEIPQLSEVGD